MPKLPGVPHLQAVRALQKVGFRVVREGKQIVMSDGRRILTIPGANPVNAYTMGGIARDAGLTVRDAWRCLPAYGKPPRCTHVFVHGTAHGTARQKMRSKRKLWWRCAIRTMRAARTDQRLSGAAGRGGRVPE